MNKNNIFRYSGITAISIYLIFTLIAYLHYPTPFSPLKNWLSDLGNPLENPIGCYFYNTGCCMIALLAIVFYFGLNQWQAKTGKIKLLIFITQFAGVFSSLSLLITAIFPLGSFTAIHKFWSFMLYSGLVIFELFLAITTLYFPRAPKWIGYYGILATVMNSVILLFTFFLNLCLSLDVFFYNHQSINN